jgi:hypothetical protein
MLLRVSPDGAYLLVSASERPYPTFSAACRSRRAHAPQEENEDETLRSIGNEADDCQGASGTSRLGNKTRKCFVCRQDLR